MKNKSTWALWSAVCLSALCVATLYIPYSAPASDTEGTLADDARGAQQSTHVSQQPTDGYQDTTVGGQGFAPTTTNWEDSIKPYVGATSPTQVVPQYDSLRPQKRGVRPLGELVIEDTSMPATPRIEPYTPPQLRGTTLESDEEKVRAYGNNVGDVIQTAIRAMGDQNNIMASFVAHTAEKNNVRALAAQYDALADSLTTMPHADGFSAAARSLADGYAGVASGTRQLSDATPDTLVNELYAYNKTVETFANAFIAYASLFGAYGVTFSPDEPGGIFTPAVTAL